MEEILKHVKQYEQFTNANPNSLPTLNIGLGANTEFARPMGVCITSLTLHNPNYFLVFHVFTNLFSQSDFERLKETCLKFSNINIYLYKVNEASIAHLPVLRNFPLAIYYRLLMPLILKDLDRLLYLDSDILCLKNIGELAGINLSHHLAAVIRDKKSAPHECRLKMAKESYFNSGVILINIPEWLKDHISEQAIALLSDPANGFLYPDQDALNILLQNKRMMISEKWNYLCEPNQIDDIPADTVLVHYVAGPKPWKVFCNAKNRFYYLGVEKESAWAGLPLEMPRNYREAREYYRKLWVNGDIQWFVWFWRFVRMRHAEKRNKN